MWTKTCNVPLWHGESIARNGYLGFDTETEVIEEERGRIPRLALAVASDGERSVIIPPAKLERFIIRHLDCEWIGFNWAFDFWVVWFLLRADFGSSNTQLAWEQLLQRGRLHDAMLLDMLVRLGDGSRKIDRLYVRDLGKVAWQYAARLIDKEDPYRLRYGELLGLDWHNPEALNAVDPGFWQYACNDAIATYQVWQPLACAAQRVIREAGLRQPSYDPGCRSVKSGGLEYPEPWDVARTAWREWGWLTEGIQTRGAVALARVGQTGIGVNLDKARELEIRLRDEIGAHVNWLLKEHWGLFKWHKSPKRQGEYKVTKKGGLPSLDHRYLQAQLEQVRAEEELEIPRTPRTGKLLTKAAVWKDQVFHHRFILHWLGLQDLAKHVQFLVSLRDPVIRPEYSPLVRTGRTAARSPNIQQMPREEWFREIFEARPGYLLAALDYSAIELVTLAATCQARFGKSRLAEVLRDGIDPHAYTAARFMGVDPQEFVSWKSGTEEQQIKFKTWRQHAKSINFGVPGGLGAARLMSYAKGNYGVELSREDAVKFRNALIQEVYPELELYLEEDLFQAIGKALNVSPVEARQAFADADGKLFVGTPRLLGRLLRGQPIKASIEREVSGDFRVKYWEALERLATNAPEHLRVTIGSREGSEELYRALCNTSVATLTGRIRAGLGYAEARNTPFQGLAADGAKLALWELTRQGFRIVAFVHDEIVLELSEEEAEAEAKHAADLMSREMGRVIYCDIPVKVEYCINKCWRKP
jgi:hypothetical protein